MFKPLLRLLGPLVVTLVFVAAIWLLWNELKNYHLQDISGKIGEITPGGWVLAVVLTVVNYLILIGYDWMAVRYVGEKLGLRRVSLAAFCSYACSYNFGATLAGSTIRLRLYSAWGMPALKIVRLLVILGLTFWFGLFFLAGTIFVADPPRLVSRPAASAADKASPQASNPSADDDTAGDDTARRAKLDEVMHYILQIATNMRLWGVVLLAIALAYLGLSAARLTSIRFMGRELPVPPLKLTLYQFAITSADMLVAGLVLYGLLHHVPGVPRYPELLGIYLLVYVAVVLSHVPGGYGVFEGGMLFCLRQCTTATVPADSVMAALLVFRIIYFWLPLVLAIGLLSVNEVLLRRAGASPPGATPASGTTSPAKPADPA